MSNQKASASSGGNVTTSEGTVDKGPKSRPRSTGVLAFVLVVIMLGILLILVIAVLIFTGSHSADTNVLEYSKFAFSTLLGAFGAWIGAGAAYFFGKENLAESSASTEEALRIQGQASQGMPKLELIRDLTLTAMNNQFMFNPNAKKSEVTDKLIKQPDYWWVPVVDQGKGILVDILHARVFWDTTILAGTDPLISEIISEIDNNPQLQASYGKLHGTPFFVTVALDDKINDVITNMNKSGATVGIEVDGKGKPTYCFTKQDLLNSQR